MAEITRDQFWKLYEQLPSELKEAIFAGETADHIGDICERNGVAQEKIPEVARYTGRVLLGVLLPDEFQGVLEKEVGIKKDIAQQVAREINRFVFFPVKASLEQIHTIGLAKLSTTPSVQIAQATPGQSAVPSVQAEPSPASKPRSRSEKADIYKEQIDEE